MAPGTTIRVESASLFRFSVERGRNRKIEMVGKTHIVNIMNHPILDHHVLVNNIYIVDGIGPVRKDDDINVFS